MIDRFRALSDDALSAKLDVCFDNESRATARVIACLAEFDRRRLYLAQGCSSLYGFCLQRYKLSEYAAYNRIEAARAARRFPLIFAMLESGELSLTAISLLSRHLTESNHQDVLIEARHKTAREVERIVARLNPKPDVPSSIRKTPAPRSAVALLPSVDASDSNETSTAADIRIQRADVASARPAVIKPLAPETYKIQFTVSRHTHDRLRRTQDLMRHTLPDGDVAVIFDRALSLLLSDLERRRFSLVSRPRRNGGKGDGSGSRHIPAEVRRQVWERDKGQCAFEGTHGRCQETGLLELHHVKPFAAGGEATEENIELRCRAHNAHEAELYFGSQRAP